MLDPAFIARKIIGPATVLEAPAGPDPHAMERAMADPIQDLPGEIWKPVVGHEGSYEVSNCGRVRSLDRLVRRGRGDVFMEGRILRPRTTRWWCQCTIVGTSHSIHKLVLQAFVGPRPEGLVCRHKDGNPQNNHLSNLCWDTQRNNMADKIAHGTAQIGERCPRVKLSMPQVRAIIQLRGVLSSRKVGALFGVTGNAVLYIWRGRTWARALAALEAEHD